MKHPKAPQQFVRWRRKKGNTPWHYSADGTLHCGRPVPAGATVQDTAPPENERVCVSCHARSEGTWPGGVKPRPRKASALPAAPETLTTPAARAAFLNTDLVLFAAQLPKARWGAIHGVATTVRELIAATEAFADARQIGRATQTRMWAALKTYGLLPGMNEAQITAWCNGEGAAPAHVSA